MITLQKLKIKTIDDYDNLNKIVPHELIDDHVIRYMKRYFELSISLITLEYPYNDKDYLSTYYIHYSQKFRNLSRYCGRLHLADKNGEYRGYVTLRPTIPGTKIGKCYIDPALVVKEDAYLATSDFCVHMLGQENYIPCFPFMTQETDISICAHVSVWSILRYFGNKYKNYQDTTMGDIVERVKGDWGRKTPSNGLTPVQISDILKLYGFSPIVRRGNYLEQEIFKDEIISYVESGLPFVGFIDSKRHAVAFFGHGKVNYSVLDNQRLIKEAKELNHGIILHSKLIDTLYAMDDNYCPYCRVTKSLPTENSDVDYCLDEVIFGVVPLYSKIQLVYNEVYERYVELVKSDTMKWERPHVARIYITTSNSLKKHALKNKEMNSLLKAILVQLSMPKFVWCIDVSGIDSYKDGKTDGRIIIDSTCSTKDKNPWLLMHDAHCVRYNDECYHIENLLEISRYAQYINNLSPFSPIK